MVTANIIPARFWETQALQNGRPFASSTARLAPAPRTHLRRNVRNSSISCQGSAKVRRTGDGRTQEGIARPGTSWLVPAGTHETLLELDGSTECLLIFLPAKLLEDSALADYGIDPDRVQLDYVGGLADPTLAQIGTALHGLIGRKANPIDRIFADGLRTSLAAHLIGRYSVDCRRSSARAPSLDARRLQRVLDFIEARLAESISLDDLAREACLSPYHFSRLFHKATGLPPHRYLNERRIQAARKMLSCEQSSLAAIALDSGFGSQASFARAFRKATGITPRQYREFYRCGNLVTAQQRATTSAR